MCTRRSGRLLLQFALLLWSIKVVRSRPQQLRRVCYFTNWSCDLMVKEAYFCLRDLDMTLCSHVIYAFAGIDVTSMGLTPTRVDDMDVGGVKGRYVEFNDMKKNHPGVKTLLSAGGSYQADRFKNVTSTGALRQQFAHNIVDYVRRWGFDGLDLDWEYPGLLEREALTQMVQELRSAFRDEAIQTGNPELLLSLAAPVGEERVLLGYQVDLLSRNVDMINLMAYDFYYGAWDMTAFNSPLYPRQHHNFSNKHSVEWIVQLWVRLGAPAHKINLGIAGYGQSFTLQINKTPPRKVDTSSTGSGNKSSQTEIDTTNVPSTTQEPVSANQNPSSPNENIMKSSRTATRQYMPSFDTLAFNVVHPCSENSTKCARKTIIFQSVAKINNNRNIEMVNETAQTQSGQLVNIFSSSNTGDAVSGDGTSKPSDTIMLTLNRNSANNNPYREGSSNINVDPFREGSSNTNNVDPFREGSNNINVDPYREGSNSINEDPYREGSNSINEDPYREGSNNINVDPYREGSNSINEDPYREGSSNINVDPYRKGSNNINVDSYREGSSNINVDPYRKGSNSINVDPYREGSNSINEDPYREGSNSINEDPYREGSNNINVDPYRKGSNSINVDPYREGSNSINEDPYREGSNSINEDPYREGSNSINEDPYREGSSNINVDSYREGSSNINVDPYREGSSNINVDSYREGSNSINEDPYREGSNNTINEDPYREGSNNTINEDPYREGSNNTINVDPYRERSNNTINLDPYKEESNKHGHNNATVYGVGSRATGPGRPGRLRHLKGQLSYPEICEMMQKGAAAIWDQGQRAPYLTLGDQWVGFEDARSVSEKVRWASEQGLGGVMFWSLDLDDYKGYYCYQGRYPLLTAMSDTVISLFNQENENVTQSTSLNPTAEETKAVSPISTFEPTKNQMTNSSEIFLQTLTTSTHMSYNETTKRSQEMTIVPPNSTVTINEVDNKGKLQKDSSHNIVTSRANPQQDESTNKTTATNKAHQNTTKIHAGIAVKNEQHPLNEEGALKKDPQNETRLKNNGGINPRKNSSVDPNNQSDSVTSVNLFPVDYYIAFNAGSKQQSTVATTTTTHTTTITTASRKPVKSARKHWSKRRNLYRNASWIIVSSLYMVVCGVCVTTVSWLLILQMM